MLLLLGTIVMLSATENPSGPQRFSASIGGFLGASYRVELRDAVLIYTTVDRAGSEPHQTTITPTAAQWREFREMLDELKLWQWQGDYSNMSIMDGTQWSLSIAYADHAITTHGSNSYPEADGKPNGHPEITKAFRRYLDAIQKLVGGKAFG